MNYTQICGRMPFGVTFHIIPLESMKMAHLHGEPGNTQTAFRNRPAGFKSQLYHTLPVCHEQATSPLCKMGVIKYLLGELSELVHVEYVKK